MVLASPAPLDSGFRRNDGGIPCVRCAPRPLALREGEVFGGNDAIDTEIEVGAVELAQFA